MVRMQGKFKKNDKKVRRINVKILFFYFWQIKTFKSNQIKS